MVSGMGGRIKERPVSLTAEKYAATKIEREEMDGEDGKGW